MTRVAAVAQLPPVQIAFLDANMRMTAPWRQFLEGLWNRSGGFADDTLDSLLLGSIGDATLAELAAQAQENALLIDQVRALSDPGRVLELETELDELRTQLEALKGTVDSGFGEDGDFIALRAEFEALKGTVDSGFGEDFEAQVTELVSQQEATSTSTLADEITQQISELQERQDRLESLVQAVQGDTTEFDNVLDGTTVVGRSDTADEWTFARLFNFFGDLSCSGYVNGSGDVDFATVLDTVNSNVGTFGGSTRALKVTVNAKGLVTAASDGLRPSFSAHKNGTDQSGIPADTFTKVTFPTTVFQEGSYYDATNSIWTPPGGPVLISCNIDFNTGVTLGGAMIVSIFKNGARFKDLIEGRAGATGTTGTGGTIIDEATGTDTYEIYTYVETGATATISGASYTTHLHACIL